MSIFTVRIMSMTLFLFVTLATNTTDSEANLFTFEPVTGEFTAGQTVTATGRGILLPVPLKLELLDEENSQPVFSTSIPLRPTNGIELFSLVVPATLSASHLIVVAEIADGISTLAATTIGTITAASTATSTSSTRDVAGSTSKEDASGSNGTSILSTSATGHPPSPSAQTKSNSMTNRGAIIGGTIGAIIVTVASFALLLWNHRRVKSLAQRLTVYEDTDASFNSVPRFFGVNNDAPVTPIHGRDEAPPSLEQKARPLSPVRLRHWSLNIAYDCSSSLRANIGEGNRHRQRKKKIGSPEKKSDDIHASTEGDGNQVEVLPIEHQAESSLQAAEALEHDEEILNEPDPITYRHQDSGWRDPVELQSGRNRTVEGREVIELPPDYSEA